MPYDLATPAMQQDPYPIYAEMRRQPSLVQVGSSLTTQGTYFVTRYDDAVFVLKDPRFVNDASKLPGWDDWSKKWYIPSTLKVFIHSMALKDEPDHTRLRQLVHKAFTPAMIQQLAGDIERLANELLDKAARQPVIDFRSAYALPLPLTVIANMMGVSQSDRDKFSRWMSNPITEFSTSDPVGMVSKLLSAMGLDGMLRRIIADRRRNPQSDLTTALVQAEEAGDRLSEPELIAMLFLILFAGHETTVNLIGSGTLALLQNPDQFEKLKANPDLLDSAIEEMLRYTNPVQHVAQRYTLEDVEIGGVAIPKHSALHIGIASANRDEAAFKNADQFDITRSPNRHIAFGFGIHYCLGAPLARLEAKIAFKTLLARYPNLRLAVPADQVKWRGAPSLRGLTALPVRLNG
ncbi:MAG: cytochrome P450 [Chloroflexota bacterium]|nr:cytochrome P450 [Chloroflexota bacterium]